MEEFKKKGYYPAGGRSQTSSAGSITYINKDSGLDAKNVQDAIDEIAGQSVSPEAENVSYDNTSSGLTATDVQSAIDEVASGTVVQQQANWTEEDATVVSFIKNKPTFADVALSGDASDVSYDNTTSELEAQTVQDAIDEVVSSAPVYEEIDGWIVCKHSNGLAECFKNLSFTTTLASIAWGGVHKASAGDLVLPTDLFVSTPCIQITPNCFDASHYTGIAIVDGVSDKTKSPISLIRGTSINIGSVIDASVHAIGYWK